MSKSSETSQENELSNPHSGETPDAGNAVAGPAQANPAAPGEGDAGFVPRVAELNEEINRLYGKMHGLDAALRESDDRARQIEEKREAIAELQGQIEEKNREIDRLQNNIDGLQGSLHDHAQQFKEQLKDKQAEIGELEEKVSEREQEISRLHGHVEEKGLVINQLTEQLDQRNQEVTGLHGDIEDRQQTIVRMEGELGELDTCLKQGKERSDTLLEEKQELITRLEWKVKEKYKEITQLHGKVHDLGDELRYSEERAEQLQEEKGRVTDELEGRISEKEQEIAGLNQRNGDMAEQIANLTGQLDEQAQTITGLEQQIVDLQNSLRFVEEQAEQRLEEKQREIAGLHEQIEELNAALHVSEEQAARQLAEKGDEITRLVADLEEKDQVLARLHASAAAKDEVIDGLEESIQQLNMSMRTVEEQAARELESKQQEVTELEWSVKDKNSEISELHGNIRDLSAELSASQDQAEEQLEAKSRDMEQLENRIQLLQQEQRESAEQSGQELQEKRKLVSQLQAREEHLNKALHDSKQGAAEQLAEMTRKLEDKIQTISGLEQQLEAQEASMSARVENENRELQLKDRTIGELTAQLEEQAEELTGLHGTIRDIGAELEARQANRAALVKEHEQEARQFKDKVNQQSFELQSLAEHARQNQEEQAQAICELEEKLKQQTEASNGDAGIIAHELEEQQEIIKQLDEQLKEKDDEIGKLNSTLEDLNARLEEGGARVADEARKHSSEVSQLKAQLKQKTVETRDSARLAAQQLKEKDRVIKDKAQLIGQLEDQVRDLEVAVHSATETAEQLKQEAGRPQGQLEKPGRTDSTEQDEVSPAESRDRSDSASSQKEQEVARFQGKEVARLQQHIQELKIALSEKAERMRSKKQENEGDPEPVTNTIKTLMEDKLKKLSTLDMLTGMMNRQFFMKVLDESVSTRSDDESERSVFYILLDNFREIRDEVGVSDSDVVLRNAASIIQSGIGERDIVSRFGYYVFTVLHYNNDAMTTHEFAARILRNLEEHTFSVGDNSVRVRASIGISTVIGGEHNAEGLILRADLACEVARSSSDARIYTHNAAVEEQLAPEHEAESHLMVKKTLQDERFYLVYQPIVSLSEDKRQRYEVLLRILDEEGEVVLPSQFLDVAKSIGLGGEIDKWVIDNAFARLADMQRQDADATFYIKVSEKTIADQGMIPWLDAKLKEYRLQRENVIIEVAEEAVLDDMENSMAFVGALHELGCKVALEHYGASSPPQVLKRLPVDVLKVNGGLISGMAVNKEDQVTVKTIIELARNLGMECVAEKVEDTAVLALLWQYGVQFVQGNFVQIPSRNLDYNFEASVTGNESGTFAA